MVLELSELRIAMDDWRGVTNSAERKKRQNRLNQRAYRRRTKNHHEDTDTPNSATSLLPPVGSNLAKSLRGMRRDSGAATFNGHLLPPCPRKAAVIRDLMLQISQEYSVNAPRPSHLQLLIRLNVLDGLARNAVALGFPVEGLCSDDFISPFNVEGPRGLSPSPSHPASLTPTALQRTVRHHPWIDLFPLPRLRDNILRAIQVGLIDEDELCSDLLNVEDANWQDTEKPSLIVWGDSWNACGWEVTTGFLRKWGWLILGCPELVEATNYWRRTRGEKDIVFDVSDGEGATSPVNLESAVSVSGPLPAITTVSEPAANATG